MEKATVRASLEITMDVLKDIGKRNKKETKT